MLTKGVPQEETDSAFGVISVEGSFNLDASLACDDLSDIGAKGTLIIAGEEEEDDNSNLSLPESVFLPSEITSLLGHKRLPLALEVEDRGAVESFERHRGLNFFKQWALLVLLAFLLLMTSFVAWIYMMNARNEIRQLNQKLQSQQSILPLALLLHHQRRALNRRISLLEQQIGRQSSKSSSSTFEGDGISNDTSVVFENCYFKAALTPGTCYKDWQSWFNEYQHNDVEAFAINLFNSMRTKSSQSYDFVEAGFKNMTFEGIESLRSALGGVHLESQDRNESYVDLYESLVNVTNFAISAAVDGGAKVTRMLETHVHSSLSGALNYSSSLLKNMLELVSDDEYLE